MFSAQVGPNPAALSTPPKVYMKFTLDRVPNLTQNPPNTARRPAGCKHRRSTLCLQRYLIKMYPMLAPFINLTL